MWKFNENHRAVFNRIIFITLVRQHTQKHIYAIRVVRTHTHTHTLLVVSQKTTFSREARTTVILHKYESPLRRVKYTAFDDGDGVFIVDKCAHDNLSIIILFF